MSTTLAIASLDPSAAPPSTCSISGVVTLVWPYSSSTRQCAFLLADPDFRLRSKKGQVRVRFTGASAKAVAEKHVGIGDRVQLGLQGARWEEDRERNKTPGKSVEGELVFGRRVGLGVWRTGGVGEKEAEAERVDVDAPLSPPRTEEQVTGSTEAATPAPVASRKSNDLFRRSLDSSFLNGSVSSTEGWTYASPAFAKRVRLSGGEEGRFLDPAFDPFVDGYEGEQVGKRTSFGTGLRWRLKSRTPSPVKERFGREVDGDKAKVEHDPEEEERATVEDLEVDDGIVEMVPPGLSGRPSAAAVPTQAALEPSSSPTPPTKPTAIDMPPPSFPRLKLPSEERTESADKPEQTQPPNTEEPSTPKLQPVISPTLPLPSPFPTDTPSSLSSALNLAPPPYKANSLFGSLGNAASVIERRRTSGKGPQSQSRVSQPASLPPPRLAVEPPPPAPPAAQEPEMAGPTVSSTVPQTVDLTDEEDEHEDIEMLHETIAAPREADVNESFSTTIPDDDMYDDYERSLRDTSRAESDAVRDQDAVIAEAAAVAAGTSSAENDAGRKDEQQREALDDDIQVIAGGEPPEEREAPPTRVTMAKERSGSPAKRGLDEFSLDGASSAVSPPRRSPRKRQATPPAEGLRSTEPAILATPTGEKPPTSAFSLDGTSTTTASTHVTRQSERERLRKSTYRNLFGLRSPSKDQPGGVVSRQQSEKQEERFIPGWFFEVEKQGLHVDETDATDADDHDADDLMAEASAKTNAERAATREDVVMLSDDDVGPDPVGSERLASDFDLEQPTAFGDTIQPSRVEVIELDASPDIEAVKAEGLDIETQKTEPGLLASSPRIQDSLKHSQDDATIVSEDERLSRRRGLRTAGEVIVDSVQEQAGLDQRITKSSSTVPDDETVSSPTANAGGLPAVEHNVEEHIAPPRHAATITELDLAPSSEREQPPSSPTVPAAVARRRAALRSSTQEASRPTLPLSPSNSQSLQDMQIHPSVIEEPVHSMLPPTPQLTQRESSTRTEERPSQKTPAAKLSGNESSLQAEVKATPQTKTPSRRSARLRTSNVPDVLSEWFSPRSSAVAHDTRESGLKLHEQTTATEESNGVGAAVSTAHHATRSKTAETSTQAIGFATAHSYFTPLSKLPELMNPSSQHAYGTGALDVLAVVADKTKDPVRAKTGPRDYFTIFHIADTSISAQDSIRVEVFRPYKNTLPIAEVGDVVLLRAFTVKSKKRTPYLLSTDASAWCVWRYPDAHEVKKPAWARRGRAGSAPGGVQEEVKGPPVEYGDEERTHTGQLREWWIAHRGEGLDANGGGSVKGKVAKEVAAKL